MSYTIEPHRFHDSGPCFAGCPAYDSKLAATPRPFLSELTEQERSDLSVRFAQASKQYDRLCGFLIDSVHSWDTERGMGAFRSIVDAWKELRELRTDLHAVTTA